MYTRFRLVFLINKQIVKKLSWEFVVSPHGIADSEEVTMGTSLDLFLNGVREYTASDLVSAGVWGRTEPVIWRVYRQEVEL